MIFWTVKYTNSQKNKYTNTEYDKMTEIPNIAIAICYIFECVVRENQIKSNQIYQNGEQDKSTVQLSAKSTT